MAVEIHLAKSDNTPWGFRLTGGADFDVPLTVVKVTEGSIAHRAELQVGDVIIRINNEYIAEHSHAQAHDVILQAGNDFIIGIRRDELSELQTAMIAEEQSNDEVYNIMEGSIPIDYPDSKLDEELQHDNMQEKSNAEIKHDLNLTDEEIHSIINPEIVTKSAKTQENVKYIQEILDEAQVKINDIVQNSEVVKSDLLSESEIEMRKWSSFLVKPKGPKPINQKMEDAKSKAAPYRIKIRTKKDLLAEIEAAKRAVEEEAERVKAEEAAKIAAEEARIAAEEAAIAAEQAAIEEEIRREEERLAKELAGEDNLGFDENENVEYQKSEEADEDLKSEESSKRQSLIEATLTVEQQLVQIREQLAALSELPTTLQMTLNAVTQQLQKIVKDAKPHDDTDDNENDHSFAENTETEDDITEHLITDNQEVLSVVDEESEAGKDTSIQEDSIIMDNEEELIVNVSEEELEAIRIEEAKKLEQEKFDKKEKDEARLKMDKPVHPLTPLERPIILPGGRKWSIPEDALRSTKCPKLSDDKIDETISTNFEVIVGHTVGINFLKYQPPPKNLDYLQKSEVFKMLHDMEPPPRGIIARSGGKVLAEQDYYAKDNASQPQMER